MRMFRIGVAVLARKIAAMSAPGETIGLMLPNANGAAVTFMALQAAGRVAAMLNFTAGPANLVAACRRRDPAGPDLARLRREGPISAPLVEAIGEVARIVWLEDVRASATRLDKLVAALTAGRAHCVARPGRSGRRSCSPRAPRACRRASCCRTPTFSPTVAQIDARLRPQAHRHLLQPAADLPRLRPDGRLPARPHRPR